jgi:hypothetical protein
LRDTEVYAVLTYLTNQASEDSANKITLPGLILPISQD